MRSRREAINAFLSLPINSARVGTDRDVGCSGVKGHPKTPRPQWYEQRRGDGGFLSLVSPWTSLLVKEERETASATLQLGELELGQPSRWSRIITNSLGLPRRLSG